MAGKHEGITIHLKARLIRLLVLEQSELGLLSLLKYVSFYSYLAELYQLQEPYTGSVYTKGTQRVNMTCIINDCMFPTRVIKIFFKLEFLTLHKGTYICLVVTLATSYNCVLFQFQASETLTWFKEAPQTRFGTNMAFMTFKNKVSFLFFFFFWFSVIQEMKLP